MDREINTKLIDDFLTGRLSAREKAAFEEAINKDPLLKNEVEIQNDIISSIKNNRKAQLKNRLQKVDVPSAGNSLNGLKIAASLALAIIVGSATYFYISNSSDTLAVQKSSELENRDITYSENKIIESEVSSEEVVVLNDEENVTGAEYAQPAEVLEIEKNKPHINNNSKRNPSDEIIAQPEGLAFAPTMDNITEPSFSPESNLELPSANPAQEADLKLKDVEVKITESEEYKFHYKYYNNKLFLYGSFEPYDIREFNMSSKRHLYLFFKGNVYEINESQKITPLVKINNPELIRQLDSLKIEKDK